MAFKCCRCVNHVHRHAERWKLPEITSKNVRKCQVRPKRQNSLYRPEIKTPMRAEQWRHISIEGIDMYAPQNMPIEALDM